MLTEADRRRLLRARSAAAQVRRETEIPLSKWRDTAMGALGEELSLLLQRFLEQQAGTLPRLAQYDFHSVKDPTGARAIVALMLAAAIVKVGPNVVGECFVAAATREWRPDLRALMRDLVNAYGYEDVRKAVGHAGQRGELPTDSATLVYIWTEVSVRGEIDPMRFNYRPGIKASDVFTMMAGRKWFLDRNGKAFQAPRDTLSDYYGRARRAMAKDRAKAAAVAARIQIRLGKIASGDRSAAPSKQRWPRPDRREE